MAATKQTARKGSPRPSTQVAGSPAFRRWFLAAALIAVTANAYTPIFRSGYIWDDDSYITENETLRTSDGLRRIWFDVGATPQYYPLVFTSFWLEYQLFGLNPAVSHTVNVALHCIAALLVWQVLVNLGAPAAVAWMAAFIFAVHPVHVESVAWITERKNVLSGVFYLAAIWCYLNFDALGRAAAGASPPDRRWRYYALALVLFLAALLSKTVTATLPLAIPMLIWYQHGTLRWRDLARVTPFFVLAVVLGSLTVWLETHHVGAAGREWDLSPVQRVLLAGRAAWFYAGKLLWPHPVVFVYPRWNIDAAVAWQYLYPAAAFGLVGLCWYKRAMFGRGPLVAVLFFAVTLGPALGFVNVFPFRYSFVADHFQYLASLGVIVLVAAIAWRLYGYASPAVRPALAGTGILCLGILAVLTWRQVHDYSDIETLWRNTLAKNQSAWIAAHNLGVAHMERGELSQAESYFRHVVAINPEHERAHNDLGLIQLAKRDIDGAVHHFELALQANPDYVGALLNLGRIQLLVHENVEEAANNYSHALRVAPDVAVADEPFALQLIRAADRATAEAILTKALHVRPQWTALVNELAWSLATNPDSERRDAGRALELARQAVEMSGGRDAQALDTLAAAHAANGDTKRAAAVAWQAAELARQAKNFQLADQIDSRVSVYEQGRPYVAPVESRN